MYRYKIPIVAITWFPAVGVQASDALLGDGVVSGTMLTGPEVGVGLDMLVFEESYTCQ